MIKRNTEWDDDQIEGEGEGEAKTAAKGKGKRPSREPQPDLQDAALVFRELYGTDVAYNEAEDSWLRWTGKYWKDVSRSSADLREMAAAALRDVGVSISNKGKWEGTILLAEVLMRREFTTKPGLVNFSNGTLEIARTIGADGKAAWEIGRFREHSIDDGLRYCLPYGYRPDMDWSLIRDFLSGAVDDPLARECLMAHAGLALMRDTAMHYAVIQYGPTRSGKGTWMRIMRMLSGAPLAESENFTPAEIFDDGMEGKRARYTHRHTAVACVDEVPATATRAEETFKIMTAHGGVSMRGMGRDYEAESAWTPKVLMSTNTIPQLKDPSGAMMERIVPVNFPHHRPAGARDLVLVEKMEAELPGFAVACILAGLAALNRGYYNRSRAMVNTLALWNALGNPLRSFVNDHCVLGDTYRTPVGRLYAKYEETLRKANQNPLQQANMTSELTSMGLGVYMKRGRAKYIEHGSPREYNGWCLHGLALRADVGLPAVAGDGDGVSDLDTTDFRPAVCSDAELLEEAQALVDLKQYERAYQAILKVRDDADRVFAIEQMRAAKVLPVQEGVQLTA